MKIMINGKAHETEQTVLSYEELCQLAGQPEHASATYHWRGEGDAQRSGSLYKGKHVHLADGMRFDCVVTGNA